jgi:dipeptidyl aminopeptidase/acylaminoacyl peptidase
MPDVFAGDDAPWKQRFRAPRIEWTMIAGAAPQRGLVISNRDGAYRLHRWDVATGELAALDLPPEVIFGLLSPDGRYVYYLSDERGSEIGHYTRIPYEGGPPEDLTPDLPPYSSLSLTSLALSGSGNRLAFIAADDAGFHLYGVDLGPGAVGGAPRELYRTASHALKPTPSHDGAVIVLGSTARSARRQYSLTAVDAASGAVLGELWDADSSVQPVAFAPGAGDPRLLAHTDRTGARRPLIWDVGRGARTDLDLPALDGDVTPIAWAPDGQTLVLCQFRQAEQRLYTYHLPTGALTHLDHPDGTVHLEVGIHGSLYYGPDGAIWTLWEDAAHPPRLVALDPATGAVQRTVLAAGAIPPGQPFRSVLFPSSDGQLIQGWLGVPEGAGPFPTMLDMHGGPHIMTPNVFYPGAQAWIDHGYAYLTINYRGSTTFGRAFQEQIWGNLGHWEVEDMVAARQWLVAEGIARPDQIFLHGASYGGYLTLLGLGKQPDLWAGGIAIVAVGDLPLWYEDASATLRGAFVAMLGGTPDDKPEVYARSSPRTYAAQVRAPLLIIQGHNDTRCPSRQMEVYIAQLEAQGTPVEVRWFDAGHGSADLDLIITNTEAMFRFAAHVLAAQVAAHI